MEEFEFSNNAINVLNSIFSAVMGIAYPLIIQAIERLDEKYDSPRIAKMFKEEADFKKYQIIIFISIGFAFVSLYFPKIVDGHDLLMNIFITIHSLIILALLYSMIKMVNLIMVYYDPQSLIDNISNGLMDNGNERE